MEIVCLLCVLGVQLNASKNVQLIFFSWLLCRSGWEC